MNVVCEKCKGKIKIPDDRIPKDKTFSINCPKCKNKISVDKPAEASPKKSKSPEIIEDMASISETVHVKETGDSPENPFNYLEEGAETALLCESDPKIRAHMQTVLESMHYHVSAPESTRDGLKQMRFHNFDVVVLNENFGTRDPDANHVLKYLSQLKMNVRRDIFVALLTDRFQTMDNMSAYNKSVNITINNKDAKEAFSILKRGLADNQNFYRVLKEITMKLGKV